MHAVQKRLFFQQRMHAKPDPHMGLCRCIYVCMQIYEVMDARTLTRLSDAESAFETLLLGPLQKLDQEQIRTDQVISAVLCCILKGATLNTWAVWCCLCQAQCHTLSCLQQTATFPQAK